jgi:predicted Zn-dependent protease
VPVIDRRRHIVDGRRQIAVGRTAGDATAAAGANFLATGINARAAAAAYMGRELATGPCGVNMSRQRNFVRAFRLSGALAAAAAVCGCSGAVHRLPQISSDDLSMALAEVQSPGIPQRHAVSKDEALDNMDRVMQRIRPAAEQVCSEMKTGVCVWRIDISADRTVNAGAGPNGRIVIKRGIFELAENEAEVAMVVAHEIGHESANHLVRTQQNAIAGRLVGAILLGALGGAASYGSRDSAAVTRAAMDLGAGVGDSIGRISFSKEQEREADYLSALILYRAGVDLDKARGFLVKMAKGSNRLETGILDTHPAGPERIAAWDRAVQEIRTSNGRLPQRR